MAALKWLPEALEDVDRLYGFLVNKSPDAARRAAAAILEGADRVAEHPEIGRRLDDDRREWFVPFGASSYVVRYRIDAEGNAVILRVWHARERRD